MSSLEIKVNVDTFEILSMDDTTLSGSTIPSISFGDITDWNIQYVQKSATGVIENYTGFSSIASASAAADVDFVTLETGKLNATITGAITQIVIKDLPSTFSPGVTGNILLWNSDTEKETVAYTSFTESSGVYTFVVSATLSNTYLADSTAYITDPLLMKTDPTDVDLTDKATGLIKFKMDAFNLNFLEAVQGTSQINKIYFEQYFYDGTGTKVKSVRFNILGLGIVDFEGEIPPALPVGEYYTKAEIEALYTRQDFSVYPTDTINSTGSFAINTVSGDIKNVPLSDIYALAVGEANTASNEGAGIGFVLPKDGVNLPFRTLQSSDGTVGVAINGDTVDLSATGGSGGGDMYKSVYDPNTINSDAFDSANSADNVVSIDDASFTAGVYDVDSSSLGSTYIIEISATTGTFTVRLPDATALDRNKRTTINYNSGEPKLYLTTVGGTQSIGDATTQEFEKSNETLTVMNVGLAYAVLTSQTPVTHNSLSLIQLAAIGVTYGHVDDQAQTIAGAKTFSSFPVTPSSAPTTDYQVANKKYVDDNSGGGTDTIQKYFTSTDLDVNGVLECTHGSGLVAGLPFIVTEQNSSGTWDLNTVNADSVEYSTGSIYLGVGSSVEVGKNYFVTFGSPAAIGSDLVNSAALLSYPTNTVATTTYTLAESDHGKLVGFTSATDVTVTIPTGLRSDFACGMVQRGAGQVSVSTSGSTSINFPTGSTPETRTIYSPLSVKQWETDTYDVYGDLA